MNIGKPHEPDSSSPFARHDGGGETPPLRVGGLDEEFLAEPAELPAFRPEDSLTAFGSESGSDLFPTEAAAPPPPPPPPDTMVKRAPQGGVPVRVPQSPLARTAWLGAAKRPANWVRSSSISAAPLWLAVAALGGALAGMGYAHYRRPPATPAAQPTVTEAPRIETSAKTERPAGSTGITPPRAQPPPAPVSPAPKPVPEQRPAPAPRTPAALAVRVSPVAPAAAGRRPEPPAGNPVAEPLAPSAIDGLAAAPTSTAIAPPAALTPPREETEAARDQRVIRSLLDAYRVAYEQLDPLSVAALWPGVDSRALARAFSTVGSQSISFDSCNITITGSVAVARCDGSLTYTRRVGETVPQSRAVSWAFALERASGQWRISGMNAR